MKTWMYTQDREVLQLEGHVEEGDPCDFLLWPVYRVWNKSRCITFQDKSVNTTNNIAFIKNEKENKFTHLTQLLHTYCVLLKELKCTDVQAQM